jgi:hypothetical protein
VSPDDIDVAALTAGQQAQGRTDRLNGRGFAIGQIGAKTIEFGGEARQ